MRTKFEVRIALPVPEIIGVPQKLGSPWMRPRSLFSKILMGFCSDRPCECSGQIRSPYSLPVPEIIPIGVLGWGCEPPVLGKRRPWEVGMVPFERALLSSYRPSIVTFPPSLYAFQSKILPLLCSSTPLSPAHL